GPQSFGYCTATINTTPNIAQTTYAPVTISSLSPFRILAHIDYENGLPTAGNWTVSPTLILYAVPCGLMPGAVIQDWSGSGFGQVSSTATIWTNTNVQCTQSMTSKLNLCRIQAIMSVACIATNANSYLNLRLYRNIGPATIGSVTVSAF